ncbi:DUF6882 domain-containing protein [Sorangium sp. So ce834]|uniref:DUF6882 domain-containing protein n=1 Tax=Sorangium sp. So ce834 TaxID=3133321 RepID=UPI003F6375F9
MPKPRGRRTSAEPRRTVKASSGRARAQPRDKAGQRGVAEAGSPAALRDRHERPAASARATPGKAKAAAARPAAPAKRSATSRKVATTKRSAAARKGAATERSSARKGAAAASRKGAAAERSSARKGAAAERSSARKGAAAERSSARKGAAAERSSARKGAAAASRKGAAAERSSARKGAAAASRKGAAAASRKGAATERSSARKGAATERSSARKGAATERSSARKGAATERSSARKGAATERSSARKGAAAERSPAPGLRPARARADEHARAAPPKRRPRSEKNTSEADDAELSPPRPPELDWDDTPSDGAEEALAQRWAARGEELFQQLAEHGASQHEYRADLKDGRFVWIAPGGRVSAEARARLLCCWSRATSVVVMAWADPLVSSAGIERIDGMPAEQDSVDEEGAWRIAMRAADACGAAYLYRVSSPQAWYFLALDDLTFSPKRASFHPGAPVGLVLRAIGEVREAIASRAEPADVIRDRISALSDSLFHQARYAYRDTDWVARLDRTGSCLMHLSKRIPRACFSAVAAGQRVDEWLDRELALELINALSLTEDEWSLFG